MTRGRRLDDGGSGDSGFTLVEMLVVMILSMFLLTLVGRGFLTNFRSISQAQSRSEVTVRVQNALEMLSRDIRVADPVVSGDAQNLTVRIIRSGQCQQRSWALSGTTISATTLTYPTTSCSGTATPSNSTLLNNVGNGLTTPVFTYQDHSSTVVPAASAAQVRIQLIGTPNAGAAVTLQAVVELRNAS